MLDGTQPGNPPLSKPYENGVFAIVLGQHLEYTGAVGARHMPTGKKSSQLAGRLW